MGKKLLIVNTYANLWSTGRIAAEIGEIAVKHGWQCYFAYASESNPCSCEEIRINKSVISYIIHTYLFSRILNLKNLVSKGTKIVLGADDRFDENSFSDPLKIVPKVTELSGISNEFTIDCQANSLTVLRIPCEK